jgi:PAS domain S-box-containing protein
MAAQDPTERSRQGDQNVKPDLAYDNEIIVRLLQETADYKLLHHISKILLNSEPEDRLFAQILDVVLAAFDSPIGFFGYIDENGDLVCPSMTKSVWEQCQIPDKDILFPKNCWKGIWGQVLISRRALLANDGLHPPEGHLALHRAMAVPLIVDDILVGELAVANRSVDYSDEDLKRLKLLAEYIAPSLLSHLKRKSEAKNREKAEAALRHRELVLQTLIDGVTESVFLMDRQGKVLALNNTVAARVGMAPDDLLGKNIYHYIPAEVAERRRRYVEQVLAAKEPAFFEDERTGRTILNTVYPIVDDKGEVQQFAIVGYDLTESKRIENELRNAKTRLEQAQRIARMGGWEYDPASQKIAWSREVYDIYGVDETYDPSDIGRDISYYAVEHQQIIARSFSLAVEKGVPYDLELRFIRHDGHSLWVRTMGEPVVEGGKVVRVYGNIIDISERKAEREELSRQRNFVRQIFDSHFASMAVIDSEGYILDVNASWRSFARRNGAGDPLTWDVGANYFRPVIDTSDHTNADAAFEGIKAVQSGKRTSFEIEYPCNSAEERRWFAMRVMPIIGQVGNVLVSHLNITERKLAEETLAQQNERLLELNDIIVRSGSVAIVWNLLPGQWPIEIVSGNIEQLTGYSPEEFYDGRAEWTKITHPEDLQRLESEVQAFLAEGKKGWLQEYRIIKKDKTVCWCHDDNRVLYDHQGNATRIQAIIHDISERKRMALAKAELEEKNRQIRKAESLNCMAGAIAHHYNNLLGAIIGNTELAMEFVEDNTEATRFLRRSMEATDKAADLSRQMLTYLGVAHERLLPLDFGELCRKEIDILRRALPTEVKIEAYLPSTGPFLSGHANHIAHALRQLIRNAEEALNGPGGTIRLTVNTLAAPLVPEKNRFPLEWLAGDAEYAELEVVDNGCGIDENDIDKLFDPFFTSKFTGRGLGLPIVLGIVKAHRGVVVVSSAKGQGSVFRLFLPILDASQQREKEADKS